MPIANVDREPHGRHKAARLHCGGRLYGRKLTVIYTGKPSAIKLAFATPPERKIAASWSAGRTSGPSLPEAHQYDCAIVQPYPSRSRDEMTGSIGRREFNRLLGSAAAAFPLAARGQQGERVRRVGVLMGVGEDDPEGQARVAGFQQGLADLNWTEGRNVQIDYRWAAGEPERMRAYAAELVASAPDVLIGNGTSALRALQDATQSIPIVFVLVNDPVGQGFIPNLARPGGNITGFSFLEYSMIGKSLELLRQLAPSVNRLAIMFNPTTAPHYNVFLRSLETVPPPSPLKIEGTPVGTPAEIEEAVAKLAKDAGAGRLVPPDTYMVVHRGLVIRSAAQHHLPAIFTYRQFAREGALITYGPETKAIFHRAASYVDRILRGANPGDLPAQAPTKFELAINLRTARMLGLEVPATLVALADEVIE